MKDEGNRVLKSEAIVILVSSNPEPDDHVTFAHADDAVMIANSNDANAVAALVEPE